MNSNRTDVKAKIELKIQELARALGNDASPLGEDESIVHKGILDSASLMMLILWYETEFNVSTDEEELTIDNFGTVNLMADYLKRNG